MNYLDFARKIFFYSQGEEPLDEIRISVPQDGDTFSISGLEEINWGDGTIDSSGYHSYALAGEYTIKYRGTLQVSGTIYTYSSPFNEPSWVVGATLNRGGIGKGAFRRCVNMRYCDLGSKLTQVPEQAFYESGLRGIVVKKDIVSIGKSAFYGCSSLTSLSIEGGSTLQSIGEWAFTECPFTSITIPASVTSIASGAFEWSGLTSVTFAPGSTLRTLTDAFSYTDITSLALPSSIRVIEANAFKGLNYITSITIPSGVERLESGTFSCERLEFVTIPVTVEEIAYQSFLSVPSLVSITYNGTMNMWRGILRSYNYLPSGCVVHCTDGDIEY